MKENKLYIIAGPNGAGKTTASYEILPDLLNCKEFVNADEIAKGLSPFQPESVSFESGRIMLHRIEELLKSNQDFAFETTLSTKSFVGLISKAKMLNYKVNLLFFYLSSAELAKQRVAKRVVEGGHNIPEEVIERRYFRGIKNLLGIYFNHCDVITVFDNSESDSTQLIFTKIIDENMKIINQLKLDELKSRIA